MLLLLMLRLRRLLLVRCSPCLSLRGQLSSTCGELLKNGKNVGSLSLQRGKLLLMQAVGGFLGLRKGLEVLLHAVDLFLLLSLHITMLPKLGA